VVSGPHWLNPLEAAGESWGAKAWAGGTGGEKVPPGTSSHGWSSTRHGLERRGHVAAAICYCAKGEASLSLRKPPVISCWEAVDAGVIVW
jgi:hypothetical protein